MLLFISFQRPRNICKVFIKINSNPLSPVLIIIQMCVNAIQLSNALFFLPRSSSCFGMVSKTSTTDTLWAPWKDVLKKLAKHVKSSGQENDHKTF